MGFFVYLQLLWKIRIVAHVVVGLFLGLMFYNIGNDASKVFVNLNLIFFNIMFTMFNALTSRIISCKYFYFCKYSYFDFFLTK